VLLQPVASLLQPRLEHRLPSAAVRPLSLGLLPRRLLPAETELIGPLSRPGVR